MYRFLTFYRPPDGPKDYAYRYAGNILDNGSCAVIHPHAYFLFDQFFISTCQLTSKVFLFAPTCLPVRCVRRRVASNSSSINNTFVFELCLNIDFQKYLIFFEADSWNDTWMSLEFVLQPMNRDYPSANHQHSIAIPCRIQCNRMHRNCPLSRASIFCPQTRCTSAFRIR